MPIIYTVCLILRYCVYYDRWSFTCCTTSKFCTGNCKWSDYVNEFDGYMNWRVQEGYYLAGAQSYHENKHE